MGTAATTRELEGHEPRDDLRARLRRHVNGSPEPSTVERAARDLLLALGADVGADGLRETPRRMAEAYAELLRPVPFNLTTFPNEEGHDELVVVRDIPFHSLCMHHVLPFHGVAHVAYLPAEHMSLRGVQKPGTKTVTSALHGLVRDDPRWRQEFLSLTGGRLR